MHAVALPKDLLGQRQLFPGRGLARRPRAPRAAEAEAYEYEVEVGTREALAKHLLRLPASSKHKPVVGEFLLGRQLLDPGSGYYPEQWMRLGEVTEGLAGRAQRRPLESCDLVTKELLFAQSFWVPNAVNTLRHHPRRPKNLKILPKVKTLEKHDNAV